MTWCTLIILALSHKIQPVERAIKRIENSSIHTSIFKRIFCPFSPEKIWNANKKWLPNVNLIALQRWILNMNVCMFVCLSSK